MAGPKRPWLAAGALLMLTGFAGCGNQYRPVVNPVPPTGPSPQPSVNITVISSAAPAEPGAATILDFAGDSVMAQATIGIGPIGFATDSTASNAYSMQSNGTLNIIPISTNLQTKQITSSTLLPGVGPINELSTNATLYIAEQTQTPNSVAAMQGSPPSLKQEIPVDPGLITIVGRPAAPRVYAISQLVAAHVCDTPSAVATPGEVSAIETATQTKSAVLPVGICPVYGLGSADGLRTYILNRGSGTVTVIDSQKNALDTQNGGANTTITVGAGPVYAEFWDVASELITANYDGNSISVINVTTDVFGNDSPQFGTLHTVPVGIHPTSVTVLQDGSRAYVANSGDGTVSVVNLSTYKVEKTITVSGTPRMVYSITSTPFSKIYVVSPDTAAVTVIRTDTDNISAAVQVQGNVVDMRVSRQNSSATTQSNNASYTPGSGVPCVIATECYP
jgi:YVTN family beta-propeller protein